MDNLPLKIIYSCEFRGISLLVVEDATGASSMADMGKVMGQATGAMAGRADGKIISSIVRELLN